MSAKKVVYQQIHGRQEFNGEEFLSLCHHEKDRVRVTITDTIPADEQFQIVAETAIDLARLMQPTTQTPVESLLTAHGLKFKPGMLDGVPELVLPRRMLPAAIPSENPGRARSA